MPKLLIRNSETGEFRHLSIKDEEVISVGRYDTNDLCLPHLSVSNFHALIICADGGVSIKDLKSTNGTKVNGESVQIQLLGDLDDITIGTYRISYSESGESSQLASDETSTAAARASGPEIEIDPEPEIDSESESAAGQLLSLVRRNWIAIQNKFDYPVNAIGIKIQPSDTKAMQVWKSEKIDEDGRLSIKT